MNTTMLRKPVPVGPSTPVVIYARVSSRDQEKEGASIPAQQELLRSTRRERVHHSPRNS